MHSDTHEGWLRRAGVESGWGRPKRKFNFRTKKVKRHKKTKAYEPNNNNNNKLLRS